MLFLLTACGENAVNDCWSKRAVCRLLAFTHLKVNDVAHFQSKPCPGLPIELRLPFLRACIAGL
jgi:hypothetical protein